MKLAFIADPLDSFKIYKDSTYAMMVEAAKRGHELHFALQEDLMWKGGRVLADCSRLTLTGAKDFWYRTEAPKETPLAEFGAVLMRKDPPFDAEYLVGTWLLELAQNEGTRVFNHPRALRDHSEKLAIAEFPQFAAPTLVTRLETELQEFIDANGDVVLKPLDAMGGHSVFRVTDRDPNRNVIIETLTNYGARSIMAQRYIPEIRDGDKRILLIAGKPVPHCLARIPQARGDARQPRRRRHWSRPTAFQARPRDRRGPGPAARRARPAPRGARRDRRLAHRGERDEPHLHRGDRAADRARRGARSDGRARRLKVARTP